VSTVTENVFTTLGLSGALVYGFKALVDVLTKELRRVVDGLEGHIAESKRDRDHCKCWQNCKEHINE
jgi:hypothetical protein